MNPDELLRHYERIADAPDAVARLQRFILDLAVRGKLVPQESGDKPALPSIRSRRASTDLTSPFDLPKSWTWINVGAVAGARLGKMLDKGKNRGVPRRYLRNVNVRWFDFDLSDLLSMRFEDSELPEFALQAGDVLICEGGEPGRAAVWDGRIGDVYFQKALHRVRFVPAVDATFFVLALRASVDDGRLREFFTGTGIKHFTGRSLDAYGFPLPPRTEQHRIVAKVDELMALCDRLEAARAQREAARDRLGRSCLARLDTPDPEIFREDARFALDALPALSARPDQIKQLRQTILNLAVRGRLVPQDAGEASALELLKQLGSLDSGSEHAVRGWTWARMDQCFVVSGGIQKTPARAPRNNAYPYLGVGNVYRGRLELDEVKQFELAAGELERFRLEPSDILVVEGNGSATEIGRCAVWNGEIEDCVHQNHLIRCRPKRLELSPYVAMFLNSPDGRAEMTRLAITSAGLFSLSVGKIRSIVLPLPPSAEQQRIVAKVDELMALCERLEASLTQADERRRSLLEALLHQALQPAATLEEQAA